MDKLNEQRVRQITIRIICSLLGTKVSGQRKMSSESEEYQALLTAWYENT